MQKRTVLAILIVFILAFAVFSASVEGFSLNSIKPVNIFSKLFHTLVLTQKTSYQDGRSEQGCAPGNQMCNSQGTGLGASQSQGDTPQGQGQGAGQSSGNGNSQSGQGQQGQGTAEGQSQGYQQGCYDSDGNSYAKGYCLDKYGMHVDHCEGCNMPWEYVCENIKGEDKCITLIQAQNCRDSCVYD
ncbi:MAG: hypothetical protein HYT16_04345 [DPANN group archaeon]|nr:hypothetical protein [DPANN group archaeon]